MNRPDDTIAKIKCCRSKIISLAVRRGTFRISNFYRHLQGSRSGVACKVLKEIIEKQQLSAPSEMNNQQSSSISNASSSLTSILSSSGAPLTAEPITTQSAIPASTLSSSITISSYDDDSRQEQSTVLSTMNKHRKEIFTLKNHQST